MLLAWKQVIVLTTAFRRVAVKGCRDVMTDIGITFRAVATVRFGS
jgi:hypothetical protein